MIFKNIKSYKYIIHLFSVIGISFFNLFITRILFHLFNYSKYNQIGLKDYLVGILFDIITVSIYFLPYCILFLLPFSYRGNKMYQYFFKIFFYIINSVLIVLNLIDIEFVKFTSKRSGFDAVKMMAYGEDFFNLIDVFIVDYWYLILIFILLTICSEFLYRKIPKLDNQKFTSKFILKNSISFIILVSIFILLGRGIGLRPINITYAGNFVKPSSIAFCLNTPFTVLKSIGDNELKEYNYFKNQDIKKYFNPIKTVGKKSKYKNYNVIVVVMESFSQEFIGKYSKTESYTPFLDSLIDYSLFFSNSWANGKRSIEAVPAIYNSIPSLMNTAYISSNYATNDAQSLPEVLRKQGYSTSFFHGASNGSMNFDSYTKTCGVQNYYGMNEYNNDTHFDGNWGIYDEYFLPWMVNQIDKNEKEPFFSTLFTLSSHHPYKIPSHHMKKFKDGPTKIFKAVNYSDYCLKLFFDEAKEKSWFQNTIFVITADHTPNGYLEYYRNTIGNFKIPLFIYIPNEFDARLTDKRIAQQIDIMPTILDMVSKNPLEIYSFGNSLINTDTNTYTLNFIQNHYQLHQDNYLLSILNEMPTSLFNISTDTLCKIDSLKFLQNTASKMLKQYQAIIQTYNNDLIHNKMNVENK